MSPRRSTALISITDRALPAATLGEGWHKVFRVAFDDVDPVEHPDDYQDLRPIGDDQALAIARFIHTAKQDCVRLVVHCRYGVSRSAAVAKAIADTEGLYFPPAYEEHNSYVYRAVRWALEYTQNEA